mgnify:CR=1 FL=1
MTIKEQIEIARSIASGTPREVAINEVAPTSSIETSGPTINMKKGKDYEVVNDKKNKQQNLPKGKKGGEVDKPSPSDLAKAKLDAIKDRIKKRKEKNLSNTVKTGISKRVRDAKMSKVDLSNVNVSQVASDEGGASATQKVAGNVAKAGIAGTKNVAKIGVASAKNVAKLGAKAIRAGIKLRNVKDKMDKKRLKKELKNEEFIQEVEKKEKSGTKKVIDIMRGKNSIKVNPDMKEDTVVVQDASGKDFVEVVDIVSPSKVRSDWRKEINVTEASAAWTRKAGKNKSGGLNEKGRKSYERENPGSDLKAPSKKVGNPRRKSFCARMRGMKKKLTSKKTARDPNSRINKSLRAWNC